MVIVHVLNSLMVGGREKVIVNLSNNFDLINNKVVFLILSNNENFIVKELDERIIVVTFPFKNTARGQSISLWLNGFKLLKQFIVDYKPDIIHNHLYYHHFLWLTIGIWLSKYRVIQFRTIHTSGLFYTSKKLLDKFRLKIEQLATYISKPYLISISKAVYLNNLKHFKNNFQDNQLIYNGIKLSDFNNNIDDLRLRSLYNLNKDNIICLYVSRLDSGKNHEMLLNIWKNINSKFPSTKLIFVGTGNLETHIREEIVRLDLDDCVILAGYSADVKSFIAMSDIGIFPSSFEGFPIAVIEKMAMGLPMIVSNIDIFQELITNYENGLIFDINNNEHLTEQLIKLITDQSLRTKLANKGKATALEFNIEKISLQTMSYYKKSLAIDE